MRRREDVSEKLIPSTCQRRHGAAIIRAVGAQSRGGLRDIDFGQYATPPIQRVRCRLRAVGFARPN